MLLRPVTPKTVPQYWLPPVTVPDEVKSSEATDTTDSGDEEPSKALFNLVSRGGGWHKVDRYCKVSPYDATYQDEEKYQTPLYVACKKHPPARTLRALLEAFPDAVRVKSRHGDLPIHVACQHNASLGILTELLKIYPGTAAFRTRWGKTPINVLCESRESQENIENYASLFWQKVELLLLAVARHRRNSFREQQQLLVVHAAVSLPDCPEEVLEFVLHKYPEQAKIPDGRGQLPLHVAVQTAPPSWSLPSKQFLKRSGVRTDRVLGRYTDGVDGPRSAINRLLDIYPEAATVTDPSDRTRRLPLHTAILNRHQWFGGVRDLFAAAPDSMHVVDPVSGLYPFQLAAVPSETSEVDTTDLDSIYRLLRDQPATLEDYIKNVRREHQAQVEAQAVIRKAVRRMLASRKALKQLSEPEALPQVRPSVFQRIHTFQDKAKIVVATRLQPVQTCENNVRKFVLACTEQEQACEASLHLNSSCNTLPTEVSAEELKMDQDIESQDQATFSGEEISIASSAEELECPPEGNAAQRMETSKLDYQEKGQEQTLTTSEEIDERSRRIALQRAAAEKRASEVVALPSQEKLGHSRVFESPSNTISGDLVENGKTNRQREAAEKRAQQFERLFNSRHVDEMAKSVMSVAQAPETDNADDHDVARDLVKEYVVPLENKSTPAHEVNKCFCSGVEVKQEELFDPCELPPKADSTSVSDNGTCIWSVDDDANAEDLLWQQEVVQLLENKRAEVASSPLPRCQDKDMPQTKRKRGNGKRKGKKGLDVNVRPNEGMESFPWESKLGFPVSNMAATKGDVNTRKITSIAKAETWARNRSRKNEKTHVLVQRKASRERQRIKFNKIGQMICASVQVVVGKPETCGFKLDLALPKLSLAGLAVSSLTKNQTM